MLSVNKIKKLVIAAAGDGTRLRPITSILPKELLPLINKPLIHEIVDQGIDAGIEEIIIVVKDENSLIKTYFEKVLEEEDQEFVSRVKEHKGEIKFVIQNNLLPYGNARPLYTVRNLIKDEPFIYTFGDVLILGKDAGIPELMDVYNSDPEVDGILTAFELSDKQIPKKAIVKLKDNSTDEIESIVEKPKLEEAPSNLGTNSPYLFTDKIFHYLNPDRINERLKEFVLQDAISRHLAEKGRYKLNFSKGTYISNGDPENYVKAFKLAAEFGNWK